jgi:glycosyltransferase involved in cell wall biosynthesis
MEKQLSIGFYSSSLSKGGLELNMIRYAGYLRKESLRVVIFCVKGSPINQIANQEGFEIVEIKRNKRYWDFGCALALKKSIKLHSLDWLWFRDPRDMDTLAWAKILGSNVRILYHQGMQMASPKKSLFHRIRFSQINRWVCLSESLKQQVLEFTSFPEKMISVLPLALPDASTAKDYQSDEFQALVVGRWDPLKNQHLVINAFLILNKKYPQLRLTFIGESTLGEGNQYEKDNKKKVRHLDLQNVIQFKPFQFDLAQTFAASHLLIIPSINETFGMVTIEGMRAGLPLLGSNTGGTRALIEENKCGLTFDQWSMLMDNHQLRLEYTKNARTAFEIHYHIEGQMVQWMKILKGR